MVEFNGRRRQRGLELVQVHNIQGTPSDSCEGGLSLATFSWCYNSGLLNITRLGVEIKWNIIGMHFIQFSVMRHLIKKKKTFFCMVSVVLWC